MPEISPAQRAAREEKFGPLTRSETPFRPPRLLCKRLGVPPPQHDEDEAPEAAELHIETMGATPEQSAALGLEKLRAFGLTV